MLLSLKPVFVKKWDSRFTQTSLETNYSTHKSFAIDRNRWYMNYMREA